MCIHNDDHSHDNKIDADHHHRGAQHAHADHDHDHDAFNYSILSFSILSCSTLTGIYRNVYEILSRYSDGAFTLKFFQYS